MIKAVIITHGDLGKELVKVAETILEQDSKIECINFQWQENGSSVINTIDRFLRKNKDHHIIIFTDMFGGSPANICSKYVSQNIEVITGINLPGLLKFLTYYKRKNIHFDDLVQTVKRGTVDGINLLSEYLGEKKHGKSDN